MRLKFWQKEEPEYFEDEIKPKKPRETLRQTAEKLMQKKMKADADYGLKASERILGVSDESKSLTAQLREYRELQKVLRELGGGGESEGSWLKEIGKSFAVAIAPTIGEIIQSKASQLPANRPQLDVGQPEPEPEPQPQKRTFEFTNLTSVMELKPDEALVELTQANPEWLTLLSNSDYSSFIDLLQKVPSTGETDKALRELLSADRQAWLESLISAAKHIVQGGM